jgi:hypothetical protein
MDDTITAAYANARSLLVYFIIFILAQVFTVILVVDAVSDYDYVQHLYLMFLLFIFISI